MLNIIGNILDTSGYSIHCRQLAKALNKQTEVRLDTMIQSSQAALLNDKEVEMVKREPTDDQINLLITNPMSWRLHTNVKRNWAYLIWEGDKIPKSWVEEVMNSDIEYIFVPSEHTKDAILNGLLVMESKNPEDYGKKYGKITNKIKIIPHGVDLNIFKPLDNSPQENRSEKVETLGKSVSGSDPPIVTVDTFKFLCNKGFRNLEDRGGIQYAIKAYLEEFTQEDNGCHCNRRGL